MKNIFVINGSASENSSNQRLIEYMELLSKDHFRFTVFNDLKKLPHFDPERSVNDTPQDILDFRQQVGQADGVLICTPEYVFSMPSGLKNAIEWCVSTIIFTNKPTALITASASGVKGHEELKLVMKTLSASFTEETTLLIQGIKGKIDQQAVITDETTKAGLGAVLSAFKKLVDQ